MAYIPKDARWFLAELVEEIRVEGSKRNVVHINSTLIEANTPELAYRKAMALGKVANSSHKNIHGKKVVTRFLGLRHLNVIHFPLEHGCEISFVEKLGVTSNGLSKLVRKKEDLEAFLPIRERPRRPDYASGDIMREVFEKLAEKAPDGPETDPRAKRARRRKTGKRKQS
jgi:hypothetical protein